MNNITTETKSRYLYVARNVEAMARREILSVDNNAVGVGEALTPMQLVAWLVQRMRSGEIAPSTYRQYKASIIYSLSLVDHPENGDAVEYLSGIEYSPVVRKPIPLRTSARKAKHVKWSNVVKLADWLFARNSEFNTLAGLWLISTYHVGLRPCEWRTVVAVEAEGKQWLRVTNAKATQGRTHGQYRHIPLFHLDQDTRDTIASFLMSLNLKMQTLPYEDIQVKVRMCVNRGSRIALTRRHKGVSLYTMRHQFTANAKNTLEPREIGALMGHAVDDTCTTHYGRAAHGHAIEGLVAMESEVAKVRVTGKALAPLSDINKKKKS